MIFNSEEYHTIDEQGNESRVKKITFILDPRESEVIRTKEGAYLVRKKKPKIEVAQ